MTMYAYSLRQQVEAHKVLPIPGANVTIPMDEARDLLAELDRLREPAAPSPTGDREREALTAHEARCVRIALIFGDPAGEGHADPSLEAAKAKLSRIEHGAASPSPTGGEPDARTFKLRFSATRGWWVAEAFHRGQQNEQIVVREFSPAPAAPTAGEGDDARELREVGRINCYALRDRSRVGDPGDERPLDNAIEVAREIQAEMDEDPQCSIYVGVERREVTAWEAYEPPAPASSAREGSARDEAVRIVDQRHGYTVEQAPDPDAHREEYDAEEARLAREGSDASALPRNPTCERCEPYPGDPCVCGWDA